MAIKKKATKKRKASPKQLAALAKGRAKRKKVSSVKKRKVSTKKKTVSLHKDDLKPLQININGETKTMKTAKRKTRKSAKKSRRVTRYSGILPTNKKDFIKPLINSGVAVGGAIAGSMIANKLPVANAKLKAGIPILAGLVLGMSKFGRKEIVQNLASGMMIAGGLALVRQLAPTLPLLAGENDIDYLDNSYGNPVELGYSGTEELENIAGDEFYTSADVM